MAQITLNSTGVASSGSLVLQSNGTTTAATFDTAQKLTLPNDASISGLTVGKGAGAVSTNTAVGASALGSGSQSGGYNTAVGYQAAASNTSANTTTAFGAQALYSNTTGTRNAAFGALALYSNTTGGFNAAFGGYDGTGSVPPLYSNTTGSYNAAFGNGALAFNTVSSYNTAVGYQAGYSSNHTADANGYNVLIGFQAGYTLTTGSNNCFVGSAAGAVVTTGTNNTFVGANTSVGACGAAVTTGSKNTILGGYSGNSSALDIRTASNQIVLSDGDGAARAWCGSAGGWVFGLGASDCVNARSTNGANTSNSLYTGWYSATTMTNGTLSFNVTTNGNVYNLNNSYGSLSDIKLKENIVDATPKLEKLCQVRIVNYNLKQGETHKQIGVIAQELEQVFPSMVEEVQDRDGEGNDIGTTTKQVKYSVFVPILIKALQELKAEFEAYKEAHP